MDTFNAHVGEDEFDMIFMDIVMPVMDGYAKEHDDERRRERR